MEHHRTLPLAGRPPRPASGATASQATISNGARAVALTSPAMLQSCHQQIASEIPAALKVLGVQAPVAEAPRHCWTSLACRLPPAFATAASSVLKYEGAVVFFCVPGASMHCPIRGFWLT